MVATPLRPLPAVGVAPAAPFRSPPPPLRRPAGGRRRRDLLQRGPPGVHERVPGRESPRDARRDGGGGRERAGCRRRQQQRKRMLSALWSKGSGVSLKGTMTLEG